MRLIDADKLIEKIDGYTRTNNVELNIACKYIIEVVKEQPTAFDVDKVVEQLDEKSQLARPVGWVYPYEIILTKDVMKIVKAGGIDEERRFTRYSK